MRGAHEGAACAQTRDCRVVLYMGEDARFEYIYKFVSRDAVKPGGAAANRELLDQGTLYVARFDADVRASQARRHVVYEALRNGAYYPWDFQPLQKASERYMRNHMDLNVLETAQRYPRGE